MRVKKDRADIFETLSKKNDDKSIAVLDEYSVTELNQLKSSNGDTVLDSVISTKSDMLLKYFMGRGANPVNFGMHSLEWKDDSYLPVGNIYLYLSEFFDSVKSGNTTLDKENFSQAACVYFLSFELIIMNSTTEKFQDTDVSAEATDKFLKSAKLILQSKNCRDALGVVDSSKWAKWFENELYRQANMGFQSKEVLEFFDFIVPDVKAAAAVPYLGGSHTTDLRVILFINALEDQNDWISFMDTWWPLITKHAQVDTEFRGLEDVGSIKEEDEYSWPRPVSDKRIYKDLFIPDIEFCNSERLSLACDAFKKNILKQSGEK